MSALKAAASTFSPSWMSIARRTFPSRLELKRRAGSFSDAPFAKVSFTTFLYDSPVQMMPSCDQIGVPIHFHSSTTSGSASLMSLRILPRVSPRQSPSSAIRFEMSSAGDWPWRARDFSGIWNFRLDQFRQKGKRLLPAKVASLGRNSIGDSFLSDVDLGPARHLLEVDGYLHCTG